MNNFQNVISQVFPNILQFLDLAFIFKVVPLTSKFFNLALLNRNKQKMIVYSPLKIICELALYRSHGTTIMRMHEKKRRNENYSHIVRLTFITRMDYVCFTHFVCKTNKHIAGQHENNHFLEKLREHNIDMINLDIIDAIDTIDKKIWALNVLKRSVKRNKFMKLMIYVCLTKKILDVIGNDKNISFIISRYVS